MRAGIQNGRQGLLMSAAAIVIIISSLSQQVYLSAVAVGAYVAPVMLQAASFFTTDLLSWYGVAFIIALAVIGVAGVVYMLATVIDSQRSKQWAVRQVFQTLVGILFLVIFLTLYVILTVNPQGAAQAAGILPTTCTGSNVNTIFTLSSCDMSSFLSVSFGYYQLLWYLTFLGGLSPGIQITVTVPYWAPGVGFDTKIESFYPRSFEEMISIGFNSLLFVLMLNEIQIILLSAAPLLLAILISIGIMAWIFGASRSFGGAMIAFALGLGVIYPLMVTITYGFIGVNLLNQLGSLAYQLCQVSVQTCPQQAQSSITTIGTALVDLGDMYVTLAYSIIYAFFTGSYPAQLGSLLIQYGYLFAGLTFLPFLNFMIVDAFIVDFSKVMGERVSFIAILGNLV